MKIKAPILILLMMFVLFNQISIAGDKEPVGKIMFTIGKVVVIDRQGKEKRIRRGVKVFEVDLIKTNIKGQA